MSVRDPERPRGVGEIFDHAIDLVVRNAVAAIGIGCAFELTGALIEVLVELAGLAVLVRFLDDRLDDRRSRPQAIVLGAARRFPFVIAVSLALAVMIGFAVVLAFVVLAFIFVSLKQTNPSIIVLVALLPSLLALALLAYCAAVAGLALTAIVLDTRSPFAALRVTFLWLGTRSTCASAMLVAGASLAIATAGALVGASTTDYLLGLLGTSPLVERIARILAVTVLGGSAHVVNVAALVALRRDLIVRREGSDLLQEGPRARANFSATVAND